jgi:hypothetical protein
MSCSNPALFIRTSRNSKFISNFTAEVNLRTTEESKIQENRQESADGG